MELGTKFFVLDNSAVMPFFIKCFPFFYQMLLQSTNLHELFKTEDDAVLLDQ